jgi:hypothetical protein
MAVAVDRRDVAQSRRGWGIKKFIIEDSKIDVDRIEHKAGQGKW